MVAPGGGSCVVALGGGLLLWLLWGGMHGCSGGMCGCSWGHAWLLRGACMVARGGVCGCSGGHAWFYLGACMVFFQGGMHGFIWGAGMVLFGGHVWFYSGGGVCGFFSFFGYNEIRSMSGRYASYWNAFLYQGILLGNKQ